MTSGTTPRPPERPETAQTPRRGRDGKERDTGAALRSVYQKMVEEAVPSDLLDLLGQLD